MAQSHCTGPGHDEFLYYTMYCTHYTGTWAGTVNRCYRPRSVASKGYVFPGVCHSFCLTPGERVKGHNTSPPPDNTSLPSPWTTPPSLARVKGHNTFPPSPPGGQYASYWNAFLFSIVSMPVPIPCNV